MKTTSVYYNETLYLLTAKSKSQRWKFAFSCMAIASISTLFFGTHVFPFFPCTHEFSFLVGCNKRGWLATQSSSPPPPPHPLIRLACLRIEFHLFCISQGFPAPALIPIITCKHFEISAENKTGLVSEICPRLNSDKTFTKITEFGKSATKIAKITKFYKTINKK